MKRIYGIRDLVAQTTQTTVYNTVFNIEQQYEKTDLPLKINGNGKT